ncbi:phosphate ABC transporter substrate-binding protein [Chitinimonas arctica]|uniref:Phosphate ABC transporter substrate-binding protein n=1 Tax=Chitinimonas arctica TaxID=2594795 RepID=A0A516SGP5_9NEIS|nr:phosphate ABC transporter substrate-binding protein [Chitinimonas arctica]QDQ27302.1 phosphate ABC transporter substrate-binding protein [Chitinimonas arctica]
MKAACFALILLTGAAQAADLAVIVNPKAGVDTLSPEQIANLFLGKATSFPGGAAATPVNQNEGALREEFSNKVLKKDGNGVKAHWAKMQFTGKGSPPKEVGGSGDVKKFVAGNPGAIGYVEKGAVDGSVKVVGTF